jgi:hypothetical protein
MKRLLRILSNASTAVSLVLCAATVAFGVRSYFPGPNTGLPTRSADREAAFGI